MKSDAVMPFAGDPGELPEPLVAVLRGFGEDTSRLATFVRRVEAGRDREAVLWLTEEVFDETADIDWSAR